MMQRTVFILFSMILSFSLYAQEEGIERKDFKLSEEHGYIDTLSLQDENAVLINELSYNEYIFEGNNLFLYTLVHKRVRLISDKGIEGYNKVFIPLGEHDEMVSYQARVITPQKEIIDISENAIKEGVDEESQRTYKYFAFEGLKKNSDIEYFYLVKRSPMNSYSGRVVVLEKSIPIISTKFELYAPSNLIFLFKSFNEVPEIKRDKDFEGKNKWAVQLDSLMPFKAQENAFKEPNMKYFAYKLDQNLYANKKDITSYGSISQQFFQRYYQSNEVKTVQKVFKKMLKEIKLEKGNTAQNIFAIEDYLKTKYTFVERRAPQLEDVKFIYDNKSYNESGVVLLFTGLLKAAGIKHELIVTCDRTTFPFDQEFESYHYLDKFFFYFPDIDQYLDPVNPLIRLGFIGYEYMNTYGLFVKEVSVSGFNTAIGKVKFIKPLSADKSESNIYITCDLGEEFGEAVYDIRCESTGYYAANIQGVYDFILEEKRRDEISKYMIEYIDQEGEIKDVVVKNEGASNFGQKPYIVEAKLHSSKFIEFAGSRYLFKLGELIGPQVEMYQEEERVLPIQSEFNRTYNREIIFHIPEGFEVANLESINISAEHKTDGKVDMAFYSSYKTEGDKVIVTVKEFYDQLDLPASEIDVYKAVINAAANFNKVVLIFQPVQ